MWRNIKLAVAVSLLITSCAEAEPLGPDPATADSCEALADIAIDLMQLLIDEIDADPQSWTDAVAGGPEPVYFEGFEASSRAIDGRAAELGCSEEQGQSLMCARLDRVTAHSAPGRDLLGELHDSC